MLLVPGRRRQDDVGVERRAVHAEVDRREQVELADRRLLPPDDVARAALGRRFLVADAVVLDAEHVPQEVLVPLARGAEQVRPPERQDARPVAGAVRVLGGEAEPAGLQLANDVVLDVDSLGVGRRRDLERVAVEGRIGRHPAEPGRERVAVGEVHAVERAVAELRREVVGAGALEAELVAHQEPERRRRLLARRPLPVEPERDRRPAADRPHLLLPDVVRPAAAVDSLAAGQDQHREDGAVDLVVVEPVVRAGAEHDHRAAVRALGVARELTGDPDHDPCVDAGDRLLPGGRVRGRVVVPRRPLSRQAFAPEPELGGVEIEHGRHELVADPLGGNAAAQHSAARTLARRSVGGRSRRARRGGRASVRAGSISSSSRFHFPIPSSPQRNPIDPFGTAADSRGGVEHDGLPVGVLGDLAEVGGAQEPVGDVGAVALAQAHEAGEIGGLLRVVAEVRHLTVEVELLEDDVGHRRARAPRRSRRQREASDRRTSCAPRSRARRRRPSARGSAPRS